MKRGLIRFVQLEEGKVQSKDYLCAKVFADRASHRDWRVEFVDVGGQMEVTIFSGPNSRERAINYASREYGEFEETHSAPHLGGHRSDAQPTADEKRNVFRSPTPLKTFPWEPY